MCLPDEPLQNVRLMRCEHGTNFLKLGFTTLSLTDDELVLIARAIHALSYRHRSLRRMLMEGICEDNRESQVGAEHSEAPPIPHPPTDI